MKGYISICVLFLIMGSSAMARDKYSEVPEQALKGVVRTNYDSPHPTKGQIQRKERFTEMVASLGGPTSKTLPVIEDVNSIAPRSQEEIAKRAIAVAVAAVKGEGMPHDEVSKIVKDWKIDSYFSREELTFITNANASEADRVKFAWRYEGVDVLLWALGYRDKLPDPNELCDVKADVGIIVENEPIKLAQNAKLRGMSEILDMADFYYRLHWAAIELRLNGKENKNLNEEIIMERHYALNWLIRYMGQEWDEVSTDT